MVIKVLGSGCPKCKATEKNAREALAALGVEAEIVKVTDMDEILEYDVMMTPALVIDEEVKVFGRVPSTDEIKNWIQAAR